MRKIDNSLTKTVVLFLTPVILILGLYVQIHGDYSPGGGFQAGAILASILIGYAMITGNIIPTSYLRKIAALGVMIYAGTGLTCFMVGGNFLEYSLLLTNDVSAQNLGVIIVELGVGIAVFASMLLIYNSLQR